MPGGGLTLRVHAATGSWENEAKFKYWNDVWINNVMKL